MSHASRIRFMFLVLFALFVAPAASAATGTLPNFKPSASGAYLAGQQAFKDMRTSAAARFFLDAANVQWSSADVVGRAFEALAADGRIDDAAPIARHLLELQPNDQLAHLLLGTVALKQRAYNNAITELKGLGSDSFIGITASILQAWALIGDRHYDEAQTLLDTLADAGLGDFLAYHRALMADVAGRTDDAVAFAAKAHENDPYVARLVEAYARILANAGRFDEAGKVIDAYEAEGLSHPVVSAVAEDVKNNVRPGKLASTVQQGAGEMFNGIGSALTSDGSNDIAIVFLRLGLYLDPGSDVMTVALGDLLSDAGQYEVANTIYEGLPAASPMRVTATVDVADNLDRMGDRDEAIRRLGNIAAVHPDNIDAVSVLGDLYRYGKEYDKAIVAYTTALDITGGTHPRDWRFFYVRGIAYERSGQWPKAEADFKAALKLKPGDPQVLNYLGYSWVDQGVHLHEALDMIRQAVNANPSDGYIVDSLGWAYFKLGRTGEAVDTLEQAVHLLPNDPEVNDHLGDAYWIGGRKLEAKFQWTIAADMDEGGAVTKRANLKLSGDTSAIARAVEPSKSANGDIEADPPANAAQTPAPGASIVPNGAAGNAAL